MATHSSVLAWRIPETGEPGGLPSMGSNRVRHNWSDLAAAAASHVNSSHRLEMLSSLMLHKSVSSTGDTGREKAAREGRWWMASYHAAWSSREMEQWLREKKIHPTGLVSVGLRSLMHGERQRMKSSPMCMYCLFPRTSVWECSAGRPRGRPGAEQTLILALFQTQIRCLPW